MVFHFDTFKAKILVLQLIIHILITFVLGNVGEWWKRDVMDVLQEAVITGGDPAVSDAYTINGQPGDLYPCSKSGTCLVFTVEFVLHI